MPSLQKAQESLMAISLLVYAHVNVSVSGMPPAGQLSCKPVTYNVALVSVCAVGA